MPSLRPISYPYEDLPPSQRDKIHTEISSRDHAFIRQHFPTFCGVDRYVLATLYHNFVLDFTEALAHAKSIGQPFEPAYGELTHPTNVLLSALLQRRPFGRDNGGVGGISSRDDGGGTAGVCATDGTTAQQREREEGRDERDRESREREISQETKSVRVVGPLGRHMNISPTLAAKLNLEGVL